MRTVSRPPGSATKASSCKPFATNWYFVLWPAFTQHVFVTMPFLPAVLRVVRFSA